MSTHPNAILLLRLTPQGLSRKTMTAILEESKTDPYGEIKIGPEAYHHVVMESSYNESWQISAKEGDLCIFALVTYGYGESIPWATLEKRKAELEEWAKGICERHHCSYEISISANYW